MVEKSKKPEKRIGIKDLPKEDLLIGGPPTCAGCGAELGQKLVLKALGKNTIIINTSGCMTLTPIYPFTPFKVPWVHVAIETGGSAATGILMGLRAQKKDKNVNIVVYAGDGASYDVGFESLSGMAARRENVIYICYNNSSFGNTGFQWSTSTPTGSMTTTTPPGKKQPIGNIMPRKNLAKIMAAHDIPYVATAAIGYPLDFINKLRKASEIKGPKFIDLLTTCPTGWGTDPSESIEINQLMVQAGLWPVYEYENKELKITIEPKFIPVERALLRQRRFKHLKKEHIKKIQEMVNKEWKLIRQGKYMEVEMY